MVRLRVYVMSTWRTETYIIDFNCVHLSGKTYFEGQSKAGILPRFNADRENARAMRAKNQAANQQSVSSYTFTDLAQMVCKVSRGNRYVDFDIDSDSDELEEYEADLEEDAQEVGYASEPTAGILDQVNYIPFILIICKVFTILTENVESQKKEFPQTNLPLFDCKTMM